jgi:YARHG domain
MFLGALLVANIAVLAIWLPRHKNTAARSSVPNSSNVAAAPAAPNASAKSASPGSSGQANKELTGFALEREVPAARDNLRIKYFRDRQTKMRAVAVEDPKQPNGGTVLLKTKELVWALASTDGRWIVVQERSPNGTGGMQLYQRTSESPLQYAPVQGSGGSNLQDTIWKAYLAAAEDNPNATPQGATINATGWENDSRKLDLTLVYLPTKSRPEVPPPWNCTYDVVSKQVEPANIAASEDETEQTAAEPQQNSQQVASNNGVPDSAGESPAEGDAEDELPGERFPATRLVELTVPDVNESSLSDVNYAINEMYARHGVDFKDKKIAKQFSEFSWYAPSPGKTAAEAEEDFSDLEKQNLQVLKRSRDSKVAASQRKSRPTGERQHEEPTWQKVLRGIGAGQDAGIPFPHP